MDTNNSTENRTRSKSTVITILIVAAVILLIAFVVFSALNANTLSGRYEYDKYTVSFQRSGKCTWYQDGFSFQGTYRWENGHWAMQIQGRGFYGSTEFSIKRPYTYYYDERVMDEDGEDWHWEHHKVRLGEEGDLVITGGVLNDAVFKPSR